MHLLLGNIKNRIDIEVPKHFITSKYSKLEYSLIKEGLKRLYNIDKFEIVYTENGKPYLKNLNIYISISHSEDYVCICISDKEVGVDIQHFKDVKDNLKKYINVDKSLNSKDTIIEISKREAVIKLEGLRLMNIKEVDLNKYSFKIYDNNQYVIVIASKKV